MDYVSQLTGAGRRQRGGGEHSQHNRLHPHQIVSELASR